jgi:Fis family transcriptional regulator
VLPHVNAVHALRESGPAASASAQPSLRECVAHVVRRYLKDLNGHPVEDLHALVLHEVEAPLFTEVLRHYDGNQSRAAAALGINRSTLRKKLKQYDLG